MENCRLSSTFSGHYIGSPYVFSLAARLLGYTPAIGNIVAMIAACITVVIVFFIAHMLSGNAAVPTFSAAVFAVTPVFAVHGVASYAEPLSNVCVCISLLAYLRYLYSGATDQTVVSDLAAIAAFSLSLLFAIVVKRENLLVALALPIVTVVRILLRCDLKSSWLRLAGPSIAGCVAVMFSLVPLRFGEVILNETAEYRHIPFSLTQVQSLLPVFAISFGVPSWYCFGLIWVLCGIFLLRRKDYLFLYPLLLALGYVGLYAAHVRSYYQLNYGDVTPYDALRYSINFMAMWALLAGSGLAETVGALLGVCRRWRSAVMVGLIFVFVTYAAITYRYTNGLREELTKEENEERIEPAIVASRLAAQNGLTRTYVVTREPLLIEMYGDPTVNVIELTQMNAQLMAVLALEHPDLVIMYIDHEMNRNEIDRNRYRVPLEYLGQFTRETLHRGNAFDIVKLSRVALKDESRAALKTRGTLPSARIATSSEEFVELWPPLRIQAHDLTIEDRFALQFILNRIAESGKTPVHVPTLGNETGALIINVRQCSESIVLEFENVVGVVECVTSQHWVRGDEVVGETQSLFSV